MWCAFACKSQTKSIHSLRLGAPCRQTGGSPLFRLNQLLLQSVACGASVDVLCAYQLLPCTYQPFMYHPSVSARSKLSNSPSRGCCSSSPPPPPRPLPTPVLQSQPSTPSISHPPHLSWTLLDFPVSLEPETYHGLPVQFGSNSPRYIASFGCLRTRVFADSHTLTHPLKRRPTHHAQSRSHQQSRSTADSPTQQQTDETRRVVGQLQDLASFPSHPTRRLLQRPGPPATFHPSRLSNPQQAACSLVPPLPKQA